ncbi:hypothetical protein AAHB49_18850 [Bacillus cereus]
MKNPQLYKSSILGRNINGRNKNYSEELKNRAKTFSYAQGEAKDRHNKILNELLICKLGG